MSPGATFERVYIGLKEMIRCRTFRPGEHIDPTSLADELASSITPVRDALHRLVGERLVEAPRNDGFRAPLLTEMGLRQLYGWNVDLLLISLRSARPPLPTDQELISSAVDSAPPDEIATAVGELFLEIARRSANLEHAVAVANLNDRLHALRLIEPHVLADIPSELGELVRLVRRDEALSLRQTVAKYHRRRYRAAPFLIDALHNLPLRKRG